MGASESTAKTNGTGDHGMERSTWSPPPFGCFKMNTDGGCRPDGYYNRGPSGYGAILRDHRGKWIRGRYGYLGETDCLTAEFHGIYNGLLLLDSLDLKDAILEADSTAAVGWITQDANNRRQRPPIIDDCWKMIMECKLLIVKNRISVVSCPREANKCADKLASMAIEKRELGFKEITSVPDEIKSIVDQESKMSQQESGESSMGGGKKAALAAAGLAAAGIAAWGISRMLSENTDSQQKDGILRMLNTEKDGHHGIESLLVNSGHIFEGIGKRSIWSPPPTYRFKINTDGRCHPIRGRSYECPQDVPDDGVERRPSGYAGILRDHNCNLVRGFRGFIGVTDSFTAELHGIHKGLKLLHKLGHYGAILESDCEAAVKWINEKDQNTSKSNIIEDSWDIIEDCKRLARNSNTTINHIHGKDANQCAHQLADIAIIEEDEYVEIENRSQLPYEIQCLLDKDAKNNV